jgi:hypothetical protein
MPKGQYIQSEVINGSRDKILRAKEPVSDCCFKPNEQYRAISLWEQVTLNEMMMMSSLY